MGQYYQGTKIGTCESMYYLRLDTAKKLAKRGARDDDGIPFEDYLTDNLTQFRFPFPSEDAKAEAGVLVGVGEFSPCFKLPFSAMDMVDHGQMCVAIEGEEVISANAFLPCPYSKKWGIKTSVGGFGQRYALIKTETIRDGKRKTVFACPYCGTTFTIDGKDLDKLKVEVLNFYKSYNDKKKYDEIVEILNRIK